MTNLSATPTHPLRRLWFWLLFITGFILFLYLIRSILLPFVVGILTAYFLDPAADKLEEWGWSRGVATAMITIGFFLLILLIIAALVPTLAQQIGDLTRALPDYYRQLHTALQELMDRLPGTFSFSAHEGMEKFGDELFGVVQEFTLGLLKSGFFLVNVVSLLVITPVVCFYLLRDWDRFIDKLDELLPQKHADTIRHQMQLIDYTLAGFIRGQFNVMLVLGAFYAIGLSVIGLKFAVLIGLLAGFMVIIPYLGTVISGLLAVGMAYLQFPTIEPVLLVAGYFVLGQMLEGYFLTPKLVGEKVGLHPLWVIFGMLAGGTLFGFVGILLAVPVTAVIGVLVRFAVERYKESDLYQA